MYLIAYFDVNIDLKIFLLDSLTLHIVTQLHCLSCCGKLESRLSFEGVLVVVSTIKKEKTFHIKI